MLTLAMSSSRTASGVSVAGEFSLAWNDCGLYLRGVDGAASYAAGCDDWNDPSTFTAGTKAGLLSFAAAEMDALSDYFFWTWKVSLHYVYLLQVQTHLYAI